MDNDYILQFEWIYFVLLNQIFYRICSTFRVSRMGGDNYS